MALTITNENFKREVMDSKLPVLLDFWAPWCGPCRTIGPIIEKLAQDFEGSAVIGKINVDEENELAGRFKVMSIPSIYLLKDGEVVERIVGVRSEEELKGMIDKHL